MITGYWLSFLNQLWWQSYCGFDVHNIDSATEPFPLNTRVNTIINGHQHCGTIPNVPLPASHIEHVAVITHINNMVYSSNGQGSFQRTYFFRFTPLSMIPLLPPQCGPCFPLVTSTRMPRSLMNTKRPVKGIPLLHSWMSLWICHQGKFSFQENRLFCPTPQFWLDLDNSSCRQSTPFKF
jgi:hypothetical protein